LVPHQQHASAVVLSFLVARTSDYHCILVAVGCLRQFRGRRWHFSALRSGFFLVPAFSLVAFLFCFLVGVFEGGGRITVLNHPFSCVAVYTQSTAPVTA